uniref:Uncharacterized protein n=1 Tax=Arundo donax TaxID=35708 RepID=A0A0A9A9S5_ARUDO
MSKFALYTYFWKIY